MHSRLHLPPLTFRRLALLLLAVACLSRPFRACAATELPLQTFATGVTPASAAISPDGALLAIGSTSNNTYVRTIATGVQKWALGSTVGRVDYVAFTPDSSKLVTCSFSEKKIRVWRMSDGALLDTSVAATSNYGAMTMSPDGKFILGVLFTGVGLHWKVSDLSTGNDDFAAWQLFTPASTISAMAVEYSSKNDVFLLAVSGGSGFSGGNVATYNASDGSSTPGAPFYDNTLVIAGNSTIKSIHINPDRDFLFTGGDQVTAWNYGDGNTAPTVINVTADNVFSNKGGDKLLVTQNANPGKLLGFSDSGGAAGSFTFANSIVPAIFPTLDKFAIVYPGSVEIWPRKGIKLNTLPATPTNGIDLAIPWSALDYSGTINLELIRNGLWQRDITLGASSSTGTFTWPVVGVAPVSGNRIRLTTTDGLYVSNSPSYTIHTQTGFPYIQLTTGTTNLTVKGGETHTFTWIAPNTSDAFKVQLYDGNKTLLTTLANVSAGTFSYPWTINRPPGVYRIFIKGATDATLSDGSALITVAATTAADITNYLLGKTTNSVNLDVNGDSQINIADVVYAINHP